MIYATPYSIATKKCTAPSSPMAPGSTIDDAVAMFNGIPATHTIRKSKRLALINLGGDSGLAISDIPYAAS